MAVIENDVIKVTVSSSSTRNVIRVSPGVSALSSVSLSLNELNDVDITGIEERRYTSSDVNASDMATIAAKKAIEDAARAKREFQQKTEGAARQAEAARQAAAARASAVAQEKANRDAARRDGGNRDNKGADYSSAGKTGAKSGFGYGL